MKKWYLHGTNSYKTDGEDEYKVTLHTLRSSRKDRIALPCLCTSGKYGTMDGELHLKVSPTDGVSVRFVSNGVEPVTLYISPQDDEVCDLLGSFFENGGEGLSRFSQGFFLADFTAWTELPVYPRAIVDFLRRMSPDMRTLAFRMIDSSSLSPKS